MASTIQRMTNGRMNKGCSAANFKLLGSQFQNKAFYITCGKETIICDSKIQCPDLSLMSWEFSLINSNQTFFFLKPCDQKTISYFTAAVRQDSLQKGAMACQYNQESKLYFKQNILLIFFFPHQNIFLIEYKSNVS